MKIAHVVFLLPDKQVACSCCWAQVLCFVHIFFKVVHDVAAHNWGVCRALGRELEKMVIVFQAATGRLNQPQPGNLTADVSPFIAFQGICFCSGWCVMGKVSVHSCLPNPNCGQKTLLSKYIVIQIQ